MADKFSFTFDANEFLKKSAELEEAALDNGVEAMHDITDDIIRISSQIAPILTDTLRKSHSKKVKERMGTIEGDVWYSAVNDSEGYGRFNYALWTHEAVYTPSQPTGGTDGYSVGRKYLERPLYGEQKKYLEWISDAIRKGIDG